MCRVFEYKRINLSSRGEYFRAHWQPKQLNGRYYDINLYRVWYTFFIRFALSLWLRYVITHAIICFKRISARKRWTMNKKTNTHQIYLNAQRSALENTVLHRLEYIHRLEFVLLLFFFTSPSLSLSAARFSLVFSFICINVCSFYIPSLIVVFVCIPIFHSFINQFRFGIYFRFRYSVLRVIYVIIAWWDWIAIDFNMFRFVKLRNLIWDREKGIWQSHTISPSLRKIKSILHKLN